MLKTVLIRSAVCLSILAALAAVLVPTASASPGVSPEQYLRSDPSRAIVVLGARVDRDGSLPAILSSRLDRAGGLAAASPLSRVVVSGGDTGTGLIRLTEAQRMHVELVIHHGVAPWRVVQEGASTSTLSNAANTVRLLRGMGARGAVIVTQGWHMGRALDNFREAAPDMVFVPGRAR